MRPRKNKNWRNRAKLRQLEVDLVRQDQEVVSVEESVVPRRRKRKPRRTRIRRLRRRKRRRKRRRRSRMIRSRERLEAVQRAPRSKSGITSTGLWSFSRTTGRETRWF